MPYMKYENKYGWCDYPFENNPFGYCWGYATLVDRKATREEIKKMCSRSCEFYKDKKNMKYLKLLWKAIVNFTKRFLYGSPYCRW